MVKGSNEVAGERCPRCYQPVPPSAARCPQCGERASRGSRKITLVLGACGLILVIAVVALGLFLHGNPPDEDRPDGGAPARPAAPAKRPALDR